MELKDRTRVQTLIKGSWSYVLYLMITLPFELQKYVISIAEKLRHHREKFVLQQSRASCIVFDIRSRFHLNYKVTEFI